MDVLHWDCAEVALWIQSLGYPQYSECFTANSISGRRLVLVNCTNLPKLGITDFIHMKEISAAVRRLLGITETPWSRSIGDPRQDPLGMFLERKAVTGKYADGLTYERFLMILEEIKPRPDPKKICDRRRIKR